MLKDSDRAGAVMTWNGVDWGVTGINPNIRADFEAWLVQNAYRELDASRDLLGPQRWERQETQLTRDRASFVYAWGGDVCANALFSRPGMVRILWERVRRKHPEFTEAMARDAVDDLGPDEIWMIFARADGPKVSEAGLSGDPPPEAKSSDGSTGISPDTA